MAIRRAVERQDGSRLEAVRAHEIARVLHHVHALGVAAIHPEPATQIFTGVFSLGLRVNADHNVT